MSMQSGPPISRERGGTVYEPEEAASGPDLDRYVRYFEAPPPGTSQGDWEGPGWYVFVPEQDYAAGPFGSAAEAKATVEKYRSFFGFGRGDDQVGQKIKKLMDEGKSQDQAVAIALSMERRGDL